MRTDLEGASDQPRVLRQPHLADDPPVRELYPQPLALHFASEIRFAVLDLPPCVTEGQKLVVLRLVHEHVSVGEIKDARSLSVAAPVPSGVRELPTNLEGDVALASAGCEREQDARNAGENGLHRKD